MTTMDIRDWEEDEVVATLSDDGSLETHTPLAEEVLGVITDGPIDWLAAVPTDGGGNIDVAMEVAPGDQGYLYAVAEALPSPLEAGDGIDEVSPPTPDEQLLDQELDSGDETPTPEDGEEQERTFLEETEFTKAEMEAMCLETSSITKKSDSSGTYFVDLETKRKVYVDEPAEAPEGAQVQTGDGGGTFYDTDDVEAFENAMDSINQRVRENADFTDEQWDDAEDLVNEYEAQADDLFQGIVDAAGIPGDTKATHRVKSAPSMLEKVHERDDASAESLDDLEDVFGAKFVPGDIDEVQEVTDNLVENLEEELDLAEVEVDDRLDPDEDTYYRAVHVDFETEDGLAGEVQVKSEEMEQIIDIGHDTVYKNNAGLDEEVIPEVDDCLTAQMDSLFGEPADTDDACTEDAKNAIQAVA